MNLQENIDRIKQVMGVMVEAESKELTSIKSNITKLTDVNSVNSYLDTLNDQHAKDSSKLVLIFPGHGQYTVVATAIYIFNINAHVLTSVSDCINIINKLASKGKKYTQIYIGSHGGGKEGLIHSIDDDSSTSLFDGLSSALSRVTIPNTTKILFSACYGARQAQYLKRIAEQTGSFVYASDGLFDWIRNASEGNLWLCPPTPKTSDRFSSMKYNHCKVVNSAPFNFMN